MARPDRVGPALGEDAGEGGAGLRVEQRVVRPAFRGVDVGGGRDHVEVARENDGGVERGELGRR